MSNYQIKAQPLPKFNFVFNSELSQNINSSLTISFRDKKFMNQNIYFEQNIMISDLILLWQYGYLKEKLNILGYFQFLSLIKTFQKSQQSKQTILNQCLITSQDKKYYIVSKIALTIDYPSLTEQYDELLPTIQQFVDQDNGKELDQILNSAFKIYSQLRTPLQKIQSQNDSDILVSIQKRFVVEQYLKQQNIEEQKYLIYFKEINEKLNKMKNQQSIQIIDLLIGADAETIEQVYYCVKNEKTLQFQFQSQEQSIISDLELNNYFVSSLYIIDQILQDKAVLKEYTQEKNKQEYIQNTFNEIFKDLEGYQITLQDNQNQQDKKFIKFKEAIINQLKTKFWIFQEELTLQNQDHQLNNDINKIFNKYYKSICLKLPFNTLLKKLIKIILDNDRMEGIIEKILEWKIFTINKYVYEHIEKYNLVEIDKKLDQLYQKKKQKYLKQLKNNPLYVQQVDIIINYCNKISTMVEMENPKAIVDFTNSNQYQILDRFLNCTISNYEDLNSDEQFMPELFKQTNKFCPDLSILKSTQFLIYQQKVQYKRPKLQIIEKAGKEQKQDKIQLKFLDYEKLDIYKIIEQQQDFDNLPSVLYENRIWDQFHKSLISECTNCLDKVMKKRRIEQLNEQKKKMQIAYERDFLIPFDWIDTIFQKSYDEMKEEDAMKKIKLFFMKVQVEEEKYLTELQEYVEIDEELIKNRDNQIKDYFNSLDQKNYESIEELESNVKNGIEMNRQQLFQQQYEIKKLIQMIKEEYIKQCNEIFKQPQINFEKYKIDRQQQSNDLMDIKNRIMSFYGSQLINNLRQQLEQ